MTTHERQTFLQTYEWAQSWQDLPWAHAEPTLFLANVCHRRQPGRALDIGCGAGTDSVFLAKQGWQVTALDFVPKALEFTAARAAREGARVECVEADITEWRADEPYDLVLDHGLLHNMDPVRYPAYRNAVFGALAPDADFVLLHWHPLYPGQPDGEAGPTRVDRDGIKRFFAPELQERFFACEEFEELPRIVGQGMRQAYYWFERNRAHADPQSLLRQIEKTLDRHGVADDVRVKDVDDALLARVLGPGRLGVAHATPAVAEVANAVNALATAVDRAVPEVDALLRRFASAEAGGVCADDPNCRECDVVFCKRLRNR